MLGCDDHIVIVGVGVGNAAAARGHAIEPAFVERLEKCKKSARPRHLLHIDQLFAAAKLTGGNVVLHVCDDHRDDRPGFRNTGDLSDHSDFHDLRFDLAKAGLQASLTSAIRDQHSGRAHERIDNVSDPQCELLDATAHAGADDSLLQIHLSLG